MKIDYHIHTNYSDGIYSIPDILSIIQKNDIRYFSITDHDNIESVFALTQLRPDFSTYLPGVEITCAEYALNGISYPFSIHLLGYEFDPKNSNLISALDVRRKRVDNTFLNLLKEISSVVHNDILLQNIPISCGVVLQLCDIQTYIEEHFPAHCEKVIPIIRNYAPLLSQSNIGVQEAIEIIHNAGGKAVWAHPFHIYSHFKKVNISLLETETILKELISLGIDGIEANYLDFSPSQRNTLKNLAISNDLFYTGGSDFHGSKNRDCIGIEISSSDIPHMK